MRQYVTAVATIVCIAATACFRQNNITDARQRIDSLLGGVPARVGLYAEADDGRTISLRADETFPMLSTFKVPVAIAALQRMEEEGTALSHRMDITRDEMLPDTYSPMRDSHPDGWRQVALDSVFSYAVSLSDNNACDMLINRSGGIQEVARRMTAAGFDSITLVATELQMHLDIDNQRLNRCTPRQAVRLLRSLAGGELLSAEHTAAMMRYMTRTSTGGDKLRAGLPPHTMLAHKTGSSDRTPQGIKIADNDIGIVTLPDGSTYRIAVFIADSGLDDKRNAALIAALSRIAYETFASSSAAE